VSVSLWITFVSVYGCELSAGSENKFPKYNAHHIPRDILQPTLSMLGQPHWEFLTTLEIRDQPLNRSALVSLAHLQNLTILLIFSSDAQRPLVDCVDNQTIRAWSTHALEAGGFPQLRALVLFNYRGLSHDSLRYLSHFPMLQLCNLGTTVRAISQGSEQSEYYGWEYWPDGEK
jgi:hypothetical protein